MEETAGEGCAMDLSMILVVEKIHACHGYTYDNASDQKTDTCYKSQNVQCP